MSPADDKRFEGQFRALFESAPDATIIVDDAGDIILVNVQAEELFGYGREELVGQPVELLIPERQRATHPLRRAGFFKRPATRPMGAGLELRAVRKDGGELPVEISLSPLETDAGALVLAAVRDISARRGVAHANRRLAAIVEQSEDAIIGKTPEGIITEWNHAAELLYGYTAEEAVGNPVGMLIAGQGAGEEQEILKRVLRGEALSQYETIRIRKDGSPRPVSLTVWPIFDASGAVIAIASIARDISEQRRREGQLEYLADHDSLTGLINRRRFDEDLERELARARRYGTGGAVLAIDLDQFKYINDSLGHSGGDELIRQAAEIFGRRLRETDVLARLGGDEFAVMLPGLDGREAEIVAEALLEAIRSEAGVASRGGPGRVTASIGIASFGGLDDLTAEDLLGEADIALYDAKEAGRDRAMAYAAAENRRRRRHARLTWAERIRAALREDRLVLHAQPIVSLNGDRAPRYELLVRMVGEDGALIPPAAFLYIAERVGLIGLIDRWVLREATRILAREQDAGRHVRVAINLSAISISDPDLPRTIARELEASGADPRGLCLEVTETAAIVNIQRARRFAEQITELGCEFAIDDFGGGFASLHYLKHLAFDYLKIDGELIRSLAGDPTNQLVVQALVKIARGLNALTIAEFVADRETLELLRASGIDYAQGFYLAEPKPLPETNFTDAATIGASVPIAQPTTNAQHP